MNTPNKLTVARICMTPLFLILLTVQFGHHYLAALILFIVASLTDMIDGKLARKNHQITNLGKFLDPLADKMLTTAAFLGFMALDIGYGILWMNFIVLGREFLVMSVRLTAASEGGKVVAANIWGKAKTVSQMAAIIAVLFFEYVISLGILPQSFILPLKYVYTALLWISTLLTVISGIIYVVENRQYIGVKK